ncbi:unnamed protein product [Protopolystoma xenopodis]|uniref:Uncharacterized protein n=1 Tax=Protopolystoma xenopodis TaxID=117903 RepID=A0A448WLF4_9PLAT|nr:unnamed protein product [Protopolystoma xenopodis]
MAFLLVGLIDPAGRLRSHFLLVPLKCRGCRRDFLSALSYALISGLRYISSTPHRPGLSAGPAIGEVGALSTSGRHVLHNRGVTLVFIQRVGKLLVPTRLWASAQGFSYCRGKFTPVLVPESGGVFPKMRCLVVDTI